MHAEDSDDKTEVNFIKIETILSVWRGTKELTFKIKKEVIQKCQEN